MANQSHLAARLWAAKVGTLSPTKIGADVQFKWDDYGVQWSAAARDGDTMSIRLPLGNGLQMAA
jgi:hypothetical protein